MIEVTEVENRLKKISRKTSTQRWIPEDYIGAGQSRFKFLNVKVPLVRAEMKRGYSFSEKDSSKQWAVWHSVWRKSNYFEAVLSAAHFVNSRPIEELYEQRKKLIRWIDRVDNWALSDELSNAYSRLLEHKKAEFLPLFESWGKSQNPWERRQSMVGLLFYSRFRKKKLSCQKILSFVKPQINDDHYYVQKGVGWTLRECWNVYPEQTYSFLKSVAGQIPPAGWTAATEKLSKSEKAELMSLRQAYRKKGSKQVGRK